VETTESVSSIACDAINATTIRVTWHFSQNHTANFEYYVVSWFSFEEYNAVNPEADSTFREYVHYDYESEVYR